MCNSPISLIQWLEPQEEQETQAILAAYGNSVDLFHRTVEFAADAAVAVSDWLDSNNNAQFCFLGAHGNSEIIGSSGEQGYYATWEEVWSWFSSQRLSGALWIGACESSSAAEAFSPLLARDGNFIPYLLGFRTKIYPPEIQTILAMLIDFTDIDNGSELPEQLELLRKAVPKTAIEMYYPAFDLDGNMRYVNVDRFRVEVGRSFQDFLNAGRSKLR